MSNRSSMLQTVVVALMILCFLALAAPTLVAQSDGPKVIKRDSIAFGKTYSEWSAAWEQWVTSIPVANHPLFDNGDCSVGQSGPVWFLGGKYCANNDPDCGFTNVVRTCTVPNNKALYIAVVNSEDSTLEDPANTQVAGLRSFVSSMIDLTDNVALIIDGAPVPDLKDRFRVQSPAFSFTLPEDNLFKVLYQPDPQNPDRFAAGTYFPGVDDGVYVMLSPLPPGRHMIHFQASFPVWDFGFDVTYNLVVQ